VRTAQRRHCPCSLTCTGLDRQFAWRSDSCVSARHAGDLTLTHPFLDVERLQSTGMECAGLGQAQHLIAALKALRQGRGEPGSCAWERELDGELQAGAWLVLHLCVHIHRACSAGKLHALQDVLQRADAAACTTEDKLAHR